VSKADVAAAVLDQRVIAIVRTASADSAHGAATALLGAGLRAVEVSLVTPGALDVVRDLGGTCRTDAHIGVGTVLRAREVTAAARAGAEFIVSPTFDSEVVGATLALGLLSVPGVATPSEAVRAKFFGADFQKLFPASAWSPAVMSDVLAALPDLGFIPTGGVSLDDAPSWVRAGAVAVGLGSALTRGSPDEVPDRVAGLLAKLKAAG
jgi:2-dehydro-3-deoxyphosphogluconate aldolase/(4S)-4-hydroxy-2-oxoglutarate aldolase